MMGRSVWLKIERIVDSGVRPQTGHGDDSIVHLAQVPQILSPNMGDLVSRFAIPMLINDEHSILRRSSQGIFKQLLEPLRLDLSLIPVRFAQEPLQKLCLPVLCSSHWLRVG